MDFTPIIPTELSSGNIIQELLVLSEEVVVKSAMLEANYNPIVISAIRDMLRNVNSYYSNQIEAEGTHPIDTEKAMRKEYSLDDKERKLQMLSVAHIKTQESLEKSIINGTNPLSKNFIKDIHKIFYSQESMDNFLTVSNETRTVNMIPGELRNDNVKVANHIAPSYDEVEHLMNQFESLYKLYPYMTISQKLIYVLSSHHRLVWIHPFLDGNGRVSRLFLDAFLHSIGIRGYGLWNISRGLSRDVKNYKANLNYADMIRQGNQDGRGYLSNRGLEQFVRFMLKTALDQIEYMSTCLKLHSLSERIEKYCYRANASFLRINPLPQGSDKLFKALLLKGEVQRGEEVQEIIGMKKTYSSKLVSELLDRYYLVSDGPRKALRINFNAHFASQLFPELMPPEKS